MSFVTAPREGEGKGSYSSIPDENGTREGIKFLSACGRLFKIRSSVFLIYLTPMLPPTARGAVMTVAQKLCRLAVGATASGAYSHRTRRPETTSFAARTQLGAKRCGRLHAAQTPEIEGPFSSSCFQHQTMVGRRETRREGQTPLWHRGVMNAEHIMQQCPCVSSAQLGALSELFALPCLALVVRPS